MSKTLPTFRAEIFMAGDTETAKRYLRRHCYDVGLCVTIAPIDFIYTGGEETGFVVGLVNYPRFPSDPAAVREHAKNIASGLIAEYCQRSALVIDHEETTWINVDPPGASV